MDPPSPLAPPPCEPRIPPALIGAMLLLAVILAIAFIAAAQIVQTP